MNRSNIFIAFSFLAVFVVLSFAGVFAGEARDDCRVCGMWIDQYMHTRHVLTEVDGSKVSFCSFTCAAKHIRKHGADVKRLQAADYLTAELVAATDATYLVGSDVLPVMSYTSIIAFADPATAKEFQKEHGGRIMTFAEVFAQY
jgi:nitrous oxide reductase accessory protein NosL